MGMGKPGNLPRREDAGLILKPEVARRQLDVEMPQPGTTQTEGATPRPPPTGSTTGAGSEAAVPRLAQRFHGTVSLDPARVGRDAGRIADEVISHLT